jgi:hypothetical protein
VQQYHRPEDASWLLEFQGDLSRKYLADAGMSVSRSDEAKAGGPLYSA